MSYEPALLASSPRRIRQTNELAALRALHQHNRLSRADLARKMNLNRSSSGHIIAGLTASGLVREVSNDQPLRSSYPRAGRPGIMLELVPDAVSFLGVEIGVEHISAVQLDLAGKVVARAIKPHNSPSVGLDKTFARAMNLAIRSLPQSRWECLEGFGVSIPAQMDKNGLVKIAPLLGWKSFHPAEIVKEILPVQVPVLAENDANAFAIGATYGRDAARSGVTLFLVMESGIGGAIIIEGTLFRGASGLAGEIGHLRIAGGRAHGQAIEEVIGLEAILAKYRSVCTRKKPTFELFLADVRNRVPNALAIAREWARALSFGVVQACRIIDADQIVLGGSVAALYPLVAHEVTAHIRKIQESSFPIPTILVNDDATSGSAFGAACMMHQRYLSFESLRPIDESTHQEAAE